MPTPPKAHVDVETPQQLKRFQELARKLECDESEDAFKAVLRKVATAPRQPMPEEPPAPIPGKRRPYKKRSGKE